MKTKAMGMFALLIIALSVVGFAYSTWKDEVQIEGTVHMGEFLVGILDDSVSWTETINGVPEEEFDPYKDVCDATVELLKPETSKHHVDPVTGLPEKVWHEMKITVDNAFPQWDLHIKFNLKNAGTIPAHITKVTIIGEKQDKDGVKIYDLLWNDPDGDGVGELVEDVDGSGTVTAGDIVVINLTLQKEVEPGVWDWPECNQIEPCTCEWVKLEMDFKEDAQECHTYWFKIHIDAVQWNKAP